MPPQVSPEPFPIRVAALYRFTPFGDCAGLAEPLRRSCVKEGVRGTLLLAPEGINGTIAGTPAAVEAVLDHIRALPGCDTLELKFSAAETMPFHRMKVRVKREIVTMGEPAIDPRAHAGTYVPPEDWNALIEDPATIMIDTRNRYEVAIGTFDGAIDPGTEHFSDFPAWFRQQREAILGAGKQPKVAMFCTGGIRCEKSTAFLRQEGVRDVLHLQGGILRYLETIPEADSRWQGECFVFDQRVAVGHGLSPGSYTLCHGCREPVSEADRASEAFEEGVSCPACGDKRSEEQRASYRERQRQEGLAAFSGRAHVGAVLEGAADD